MKPAIDFYFDFSSPYSYIASEWIDAVAARHGRAVHWHAVLLGATFQAAELKSPVDHPIKREYSLRDFARSARFAGVPYTHPDQFPITTQNAARVFWWLHDTPAPSARWPGRTPGCAPTSRGAGPERPGGAATRRCSVRASSRPRPKPSRPTRRGRSACARTTRRSRPACSARRSSWSTASPSGATTGGRRSRPGSAARPTSPTP